MVHIPRFDERTETYRDCRWCRGRGCLQCPAERDKAYAAAFFPNGPQPIATFKLDDPASVEKARAILGADNLNRVFGPNGGGIAEFDKQLRASQTDGEG